MSRREHIRAALRKIGQPDILAWAAQHPTTPLEVLVQQLGADVAPVDLENVMAEQARESNRYSQFVCQQLVRLLNEYFPGGAGAGNDWEYARASIWSFWAGLFEPSHQRAAKGVLDAVLLKMQERRSWVPQNENDPIVLAAFGQRMFEPTDRALVRERAVRAMHDLIAQQNEPFDYGRALDNLRAEPRGYGLLFGLYTVDGQVCNGGFAQLYANTHGAPVPAAVDALRLLERDGLADVVERSLATMRATRPDMLLPELRWGDSYGASEDIGELDEEYFRLTRPEEPDWLDASVEELLESMPQLLRGGAA